ncbi:MAG: hypothetical protein K0Q68_79 [Moraxellaceae bacterium]|jgi:hypothetical protein|nr:hypothetical protein [Moraxellaceae bacterium]
MMYGLSLPHVIILLVMLVLPLLAFRKAVIRAGFSPYWLLLGLVPGVSLVLLWLFAFSKWPAYER